MVVCAPVSGSRVEVVMLLYSFGYHYVVDTLR